MRNSEFILALYAASLSQFGLALPQGGKQLVERQRFIGDTLQCEPRNKEFKDVKEEVFDGDVELATGSSCGPTDGGGSCAIGTSKSYSKSTTLNIGGSVTLNLGDLGSVGGTYGYSYTTTKGWGSSTTVTCPAGKGYTCGISAQPRMVHISGEYLHPIGRNDKECTDHGWQHFDAYSVVVKKTRGEFDINQDVSVEEGADITTRACLESCGLKEECDHAKSLGLLLCPDTEKPENYTE